MLETTPNPAFDDHELTQSQKLILTGQQLQPDDPLYNMVLTFRIEGKVDPEHFQQAFSTLINCCDALRIVFLVSEKQGVKKPSDKNDFVATQRILAQVEYQVEQLDFSTETNPEASLKLWIEGRKKRRFDLRQCLFDSVLIKLAETSYVWYFNQHHLVTDAWSSGVIFKNLQAYYALAKQRRIDAAIPLPDFRHYIDSEKTKHRSRQFTHAQAYWTEQLNIPFSASHFYRPIPTTRSAVTRRFHCEFGNERSQRFRQLAAGETFGSFSPDLSLMQLFSTMLFAYMYRIRGNDNLSIGTPCHSRTSVELKETAGLLINIFPLKICIEEGESFLSLYEKVAHANQRMLINALPGANDVQQNRAFDVVLNYIPSSFSDFAGLPVQSDWVHSDYGDRNHLLRLQVHNFDQKNDFTLYFDLNEDAFVGNENLWVSEHFLILVDAFLANAEQLISVPALLDNTAQLSYQLERHSSRKVFGAETNILDLLQRQAEANPDGTALVCAQAEMSYQKLAQRSLQLAHYLSLQGFATGGIIAVMMERSIEAIVAILGVMKAGFTFLPIDLNYPQKRIDFILNDADVELVLGLDNERFASQAYNCRRLCVDANWGDIENISSAQPLATITPDDRAYVIYTSGSTGKPKGVEVLHRGLQNYITWAKDYYLEGEILNFALFSSLSFDLSITSLFVPLISGGKLIIYPDPIHASEITIRSVIEDNKVDVIKLTPSHLALIQTMDFSTSRLKKLIVGGDDFKTELAHTISKYFANQLEIYNEYGPTEATVACTVHKYDPLSDHKSSLPIGRPINNSQIYLYDNYFNLVPQGVTGEVFIGGEGLAKGYFKQALLTEKCFIRRPNHEHERLYKTGDLACYNEYGQLEFLGRNDQQVKVRGVRIETSEIEAALLTIPGISDAVVDLTKYLALSGESEEFEHCARCGLAANHPSARLDEQKICHICRIYTQQEAQAHAYYRELDELHAWIKKIKREANGKQDSIMLLSGGKDSSYALCKLVDMGLTPLVFTLDNGFISDGAKANIKRLVDRLGLELVVGETPAMNAIFVDSLTRFSNVCNGCFKTIYTLSMNIARERGIKVICTGLSRGQIFETRVAHLFQQGCFDANKIDQRIIDARKTYHRTQDIIATTLDVSIFQDDKVFEEIQYLDFYRYTDVTLDEMYHYLNNIAPWIRPSDTGRSTNCLINDAGIYVHKKERGYHNYALPYSWDVRLGHKERNAALAELDDELDLKKVNEILKEVGYQSPDIKPDTAQENKLIGYYVAAAEMQKNTLQKHLSDFLPNEYVPSQFVWMKALPLTENGKIDRQALPRPRYNLREASIDYVAPDTDTETTLASLWSELLGVKEVGVADNFFDLGGDSIVNIQIVAAAREKGIDITPQQIFDYPTIKQLSQVAGSVVSISADQGTVIGSVPLLPSQQRFFDNKPLTINQFNQSVTLEYSNDLSTVMLTQALKKLLLQHDGLRSRFSFNNDGWQQSILAPEECSPWITEVDASACSTLTEEIEQQRHLLSLQLDIHQGKLVAAANIITPTEQANILLIVIHHLVVDGVSWWILLSDLDSCCRQISKQQSVTLAGKTCSVKQWANALRAYAQSDKIFTSQAYWNKPIPSDVGLQSHAGDPMTTDLKEYSICLSAQHTQQLINEVPAKLSVQVPELLLTALLKAVLSEPNVSSTQTKLLIDVEGHGREELVAGYDVMRTVAWFTSIYPLLLSLSDSDSLSDDLKAVKEQMRRVPNRGIEYAILRHLSTKEQSIEALTQQPQADILFNYMGQWERTLSSNSQFKFVDAIQASYGEERLNQHVLEINAMVFDGCLKVDWCYNAQRLEPTRVKLLADSFRQNLQDLISHCLSVEDHGLTPVDFPSAELKQQDLEDIFSEFGEE